MVSAFQVKTHGQVVFNSFKSLEFFLSLYTFDFQKKEAKNQEGYNHVPHLTQDSVWESDKAQENIT